MQNEAVTSSCFSTLPEKHSGFLFWRGVGFLQHVSFINNNSLCDTKQYGTCNLLGEASQTWFLLEYFPFLWMIILWTRLCSLGQDSRAVALDRLYFALVYVVCMLPTAGNTVAVLYTTHLLWHLLPQISCRRRKLCFTYKCLIESLQSCLHMQNPLYGSCLHSLRELEVFLLFLHFGILDKLRFQNWISDTSGHHRAAP